MDDPEGINFKEGDDEVVDQQSNEPFGEVELGETPLVPLWKQRKSMLERRVENRALEAAGRTASSIAWRGLARALSAATYASAMHDCRARFKVDPSHNCMYCGWFVGCLRCGTIVAAQTQAAISRSCCGYKPAGSVGAIRKLASGKLPRGRSWPSGGLAPWPQPYYIYYEWAEAHGTNKVSEDTSVPRVGNAVASSRFASMLARVRAHESRQLVALRWVI